MNGPEHYREAEGLLAYAMNHREDTATYGGLVSAAHAHATLALVAATLTSTGTGITEAADWREVTA